MNFEKSLMRPFQDVKKLAIGVLLNIIPVVSLFSTGYVIKSAHMVGKRKPDYSLPEWDSWGELFVHGVMSVLISFLWMLPIIIITVALGGGVIIAMIFSGATFGSVAATTANLGVLLVALLIVMFLSAYMFPLAIAEYSRNYKLSEALNLRILFRKAFRKDYFVAWAVSGVYMIVAVMIFSWLRWVGMAVVNFVVFMTGLTLIVESVRDV